MPLRTRRFEQLLTIATIVTGLFLGACSEKPVVAPTPAAQFAMGGGDKGGKPEDKDKGKDKDVKVMPKVVTLKVGESRPTNVTTKGTCTSERMVTYETANPSIATVSPTGVVSGHREGTTTLTARCAGASDEATVNVMSARGNGVGKNGESGGGGGGTADPTQLPEARGQTPPVTSTYGRTLTAGQTYQDPLTGVTVLKVTDLITPYPNPGMDKGYSEGGPIISQPWMGADGETYYTLQVAQNLVDLRYSTLELLNWRTVLYTAEIGLAFSLNPATPRIAYLTNDGRTVSRYNTATNTTENTPGTWPWIPTSEGEFLTWLQTNLNDSWLVAMFNSNNTVVAYRPSDRLQQDFTQLETALDIDEPHIDRELGKVYLATNNDDRQNVVGDLLTGTWMVPNNSAFQSDDHEAPLRGMVTGLSNFVRHSNFYYDVRADTTVEYADASQVIGLPGDWHMAGQWVFGNGTGPAQWFIIDSYGTPDPTAAIQSGLIGIVRPSPFSARLVAVHDSRGITYEGQPQSTFAPDGKLVMWTSDMGGQPRTDVFVAKLPVR
jgi:hypothetical protein